MERLLWVCLGSAIGGGARYLTSLAALALLGTAFPYGTLVVNVVGSYLLGMIMQVSLTTEWIAPTVRVFLATGIMGGLTTYSTFNYETLALIRDGTWEIGLVNVLATVFSCLVAGALGLATARLVSGT